MSRPRTIHERADAVVRMWVRGYPHAALMPSFGALRNLVELIEGMIRRDRAERRKPCAKS